MKSHNGRCDCYSTTSGCNFRLFQAFRHFLTFFVYKEWWEQTYSRKSILLVRQNRVHRLSRTTESIISTAMRARAGILIPVSLVRAKRITFTFILTICERGNVNGRFWLKLPGSAGAMIVKSEHALLFGNLFLYIGARTNLYRLS